MHPLFYLLMCIVCAACISEHVTLHAGDLPYEIEWDGSVISLNITKQTRSRRTSLAAGQDRDLSRLGHTPRGKLQVARSHKSASRQ